MATTNDLPPPPLVVQEPGQCWYAAYESWLAGNGVLFERPGAFGLDREQVHAALARGGMLLGREGRASNAGVRLLAGLAAMRLREVRAAAVTPRLLAPMLADGYVYAAYYWPNRRGGENGHAVVVYGADDGAVRFMDPFPNRGLVSEPASFFATHARRVVLGVSMYPDLGRSVAAAVGRLR